MKKRIKVSKIQKHKHKKFYICVAYLVMLTLKLQGSFVCLFVFGLSIQSFSV